MGRGTINGTVAQFSAAASGLSRKCYGDAIENKAKGKNMEAREPNFVLDNIKAQIIKDYQRISRP